MKAFSRLVAAAVFALVASFAFSQPMPVGGGQTQIERLKHFGLSDDQAKQVSDILTKERTTAVPQRAQLKVLNAQIELAMTASKPDLNAVNALVDKKAQLRTEMEKQFLASAAEIHGIVGDQLFAQLSQAYLAHRRAQGGMGMRWNHSQGGPTTKPAGPAQPQNP
jgi:Spy/CpxP family protein refolding chaperone